jgi:uncharacterized membrane protein
MAQPVRADSGVETAAARFTSDAVQETPSPERVRSRIDSVDLLRGLVMVIMMLDHTRDFVHHDTFFFDPSDITRTYPALFFTRWITHFCAPVFVFLSGSGAYFQLARGKPRAELSRFLVKRGLWMIVLEFTLIRFLVFWNVDYSQFLGMAQVIWVFGWSMILLAGLIYLPLRAVTVFGLTMIALHNLLDPIRVTPWQGPGTPAPDLLGSLWMVLHQSGVVLPLGFPGPILLILYPLIPWLGVMAVGYTMASIYDRSPQERRRWLIRWGSAITIGFILIRATTLYGDPQKWSAQKSALMTVASFFNTTKYPPSLLYLMMTLGPALLGLALWEKYNRRSEATVPSSAPGPVSRLLITYGRVPLFFYILQWTYSHSAGYLLSLAAGKPTSIYFGLPGPGTAPSPNVGFDLWVVYVVWLAGVLLLYPVCKWYGSVKARRKDWWLSYL